MYVHFSCVNHYLSSLRTKRDVPLYKESILNVEMKIVNSNFIALFLHTQMGYWHSADERWHSNLHPPIVQRHPSIVARPIARSMAHARSADGADPSIARNIYITQVSYSYQ